MVPHWSHDLLRAIMGFSPLLVTFELPAPGSETFKKVFTGLPQYFPTPVGEAVAYETYTKGLK